MNPSKVLDKGFGISDKINDEKDITIRTIKKQSFAVFSNFHHYIIPIVFLAAPLLSLVGDIEVRLDFNGSALYSIRQTKDGSVPSISSIFTDFLPHAACHVVQGFKEVFTNGFDERNNHPIGLSHFLPYTPFKDGVDLSNGDEYWEDAPNVTRVKCLALVAATPIVHAAGLLLNVANRIAKLVLLAHFWYPSREDYCFSERAWTFGKDLLRVAFTPIIYIGLEISAVYGLILPDNGRKLYATFERSAYGKELLAPCFQPEPTRHLGGGIPGKKNEW